MFVMFLVSDGDEMLRNMIISDSHKNIDKNIVNVLLYSPNCETSLLLNTQNDIHVDLLHWNIML